MARTKQEVRNFLDGLVGQVPTDKSDASLNGQCVALIKNLLEFLGVDNPYGARGNAKDVGDRYVADGIADNCDGWLRVCVNRNMGGGYGHVWLDLSGETNYESNGARALVTTKGTRPIGQAQQIVNLDKWLTEGDVSTSTDTGGRVAQTGTYEATETMVIRSEPRIADDTKVTTLATGQSVIYDSYIDTNGYRWISYVGYSGNRRYIARRNLANGEIYGRCY